MSERNRFVLLHHVLRDSDHWDLMFDLGPVLATWQVLDDPALLASGKPLRAMRIADHRRAYLDYEGPVSGDRGHVTRTDGGDYQVAERREDVWVVLIEGAVLNGTYRLGLDGTASGAWLLERLAPPASGSIVSTSAPG